MRGYRRRGTASYLVGVAVSFLLVVQLAGTLLQLPDKPHWGLVIQGTDQIVRRVMPDSPAERAGIRVGDEVQSFAGVGWARSWDRTYEPDGSAVARVRTPGEAPRDLRIERVVAPPHEIVRRLVQGLVGLAFVVLGLVVFLSRSDRVATLFFLMSLLLSRIVLPEPEHAGRGTFLFDKATLDIAWLFLAPVVLHFFLNFPVRTRIAARHPRAVWLLYVPSAVAAAIVLKFDVDLITGPDRIPPSAIALQLVTAVVSVAMIVVGVGLFLRGVRKASSPVLRRSLRWVLPGTALGILPPLLMTVILSANPTLTLPGDRYIFLTFLLVPLTFAHSIFRYGLLDLELVVKRSVIYATLTALLVAVYYLVAELLGSWVTERTGAGRTLFSFAVVFATALAFIPVRDRVQRLVDRSFYRERYSYRSTLRKFASDFANFLERDDLARLLVERLPELLGVERAVLFVRSSPDDSLHLAGTLGLGATEIAHPVLHPSPALLGWWREYGGPVPVEPRRDPRPIQRLSDEERALLATVDPSVLVFLPRERRVEGILLLGPKRSGDRYQAQDLELLATLGDQAGTALSSSRLHEEALERRRMEEELAVARKIQASLLPSKVPQCDGIEIAALTRPCQEVGGDFYDFLDFGSAGLGLAVADVSGKGVPAALLLSSLQATLRSAATPGDPEPMVQRVNERLCADAGPAVSFATLFYAHLDPGSRTLRYVNAGHPAGLVVGRDGSVRRLEEGGLLLGMEPEATYRAGTERLEPGEVLLIYSDGVTDVLNARDEDYGPDRLETLLPRLTHLPGQAILENVIASVEAFVGGSVPDDITLLVARILPSGAQPRPA